MKQVLAAYRKIYNKMMDFETPTNGFSYVTMFEDMFGRRSYQQRLTYAQYVYVMFFNLDLTFVSLGKNKGSIGFAAARLRVFSGKSLSEIKAKTPRRVNQVYSDSEEADSDHDGQNEESTQEWFIKDTLEKGKVPVPWSKNLIQVNQIKSNPLFEKPQPGETKFNGLWKPEMSVPVATFCKLAGFAQMCKDGFLTEFPFNAHMLP